MYRKVLATTTLFLMLPVMSLAQTAVPTGVPQAAPDPQFINNIIQELQAQRGTALDAAANAKAQLTLVQSKLEAVNKELAELKAKAAAPAPEPAK